MGCCNGGDFDCPCARTGERIEDKHVISLSLAVMSQG